MEQAQHKYLIIGTGRSGSSLISAILADAGAVFDLPNIPSWNTRSGAYEHPKLISACKWLHRYRKVSSLSDRLKKFCENKIIQELSDLFQSANFAKYPMAVGLVHLIPRLGYQPKVIISYRDFASYSQSMYYKNGIEFQNLTKSYKNTNNMALLQLDVFGGCVIDYDEIVDFKEVDWAHNLASLTGLDVAQILESRNKRANKRQKNKVYKSNICIDNSIECIYKKLLSLKGKVISGNY